MAKKINEVGLTNVNNSDNIDTLVRAISYEEDEVENTEETQEPNGLVKAITYIPEDDNKKYLILITGEEYSNENIEYRSWEIIESRQMTYDWIKELLLNGDENNGFIFDIMKSKVLVDSENVPLSKAISVYRFMTLMKTEDKVVDDSTFDIEDYAYELEEDKEGDY